MKQAPRPTRLTVKRETLWNKTEENVPKFQRNMLELWSGHSRNMLAAISCIYEILHLWMIGGWFRVGSLAVDNTVRLEYAEVRVSARFQSWPDI